MPDLQLQPIKRKVQQQETEHEKPMGRRRYAAKHKLPLTVGVHTSAVRQLIKQEKGKNGSF